MRIALGIAYDGRGFTGWQTQPDGRGVQDALERALRQFACVPVATTCAGRTDTGVHALDQVVHFDTDVVREPVSWVRGVNRYLPRTVGVRWAMQVPAAFHARFGARLRCYDYWILNDPVRSPLHDGRTGWVFRPLDATVMAAAAALLEGEHDFSSFRAADCQAATPVRRLQRLAVTRHGPLVRVQAHADAFLHHMVRNLVGALVWVGTGRKPPGWVAEVLAARDRSVAAPTFAPDGLFLARVQYDQAFALPEPVAAFGLPV